MADDTNGNVIKPSSMHLKCWQPGIGLCQHTGVRNMAGSSDLGKRGGQLCWKQSWFWLGLSYPLQFTLSRRALGANRAPTRLRRARGMTAINRRRASGVVRSLPSAEERLEHKRFAAAGKETSAPKLVDRSRASGSANERVGALTAKATRSARASIAAWSFRFAAYRHTGELLGSPWIDTTRNPLVRGVGRTFSTARRCWWCGPCGTRVGPTLQD